MLYKKSILFSLVVILFLFVISDSSAAKKQTPPTAPQINHDIITLYDEVDLNTSYDIITKIHEYQNYNKNKPIFLYIDSPGGDVLEGTKIIDAMQASKRPIYTVDVGYAASMAAYIFEYGNVRIMLPRSVLMFHHASGSYEGDINKMKSRLIMVERLMGSLDYYVASRTGISYEELTNKESNEWWLLSDEATQFKLVDKVIDLYNFPAHAPKNFINIILH